MNSGYREREARSELYPDACDDPGVACALRIVLVVALNTDEAQSLLGKFEDDEAVSLWPSSVYGCLTSQMMTSPACWQCSAAQLDRRLSPWLFGFHKAPPLHLVEALRQSRDTWSVPELAALLWELLRRDERALDPLLHRLAAEVETTILRSIGCAGRTNAEQSPGIDNSAFPPHPTERCVAAT
ncbi:MAG: hypothetical protein MJE77_00105 [Proteobacteria bacterium]|nr:hypothetical protein [Pseudomonadota bacterium]